MRFFRFTEGEIDMTTLIYTHKPEHYKNYSQFTSVKQFNSNIEMWLADHKTVFGRKELQAIKVLLRHSVKVAGIATIKFNSLVRVAAETYDYVFSVKTAKRAVTKAKRLGMLVTLATKSDKTDLKAPSVYVWQKYKNVPTLNETVPTAETATNVDVTTSSQNATVSACEDEMSLHKTGVPEASIIKYYIRKSAKAFKSIACKMSVKKSAPVELIEQPVKPKTAFKPLKFISRLKDVVYKSLLNKKDDVTAIIEIVHANIYEFSKLPAYKPFKDELLEKALRIVDACLTAHKQGSLDYIKSMRGFIDSRIKAELRAFSELKVMEADNLINQDVHTNIADMYTDALEGTYQTNYNKGMFYDWT